MKNIAQLQALHFRYRGGEGRWQDCLVEGGQHVDLIQAAVAVAVDAAGPAMRARTCMRAILKRPELVGVLATALVLALTGCATVPPGDAAAGSRARAMKAAPDAVAIYFCRDGSLAGGGNNLYPLVDGEIVAALATNTFTRVELRPGDHEIALAYSQPTDSAFFRSLARGPVKMEDIHANAGEVRRYWIGVAGSSLFGGSLTIDHFDSVAQAKDCIDRATYVDPRSPGAASTH